MTRVSTTRTLASGRQLANGVNSLASVTPDVSIPLTSDKTITGGAGGSVTQTRASVAWYPDDNGVLQYYLTNVAGQNSKGIFIHPARVNVCTNYNASPDASITNVSASSGSVTRVDRTALLAAAGLENICTQYAFQYANTTGSQQTVSISGALGATTNAAMSCYARCIGGSAQMQLSVSGAGTYGLNESAAFVRYVREEITGTDATDLFQFVVPNGVTIEWVLNQLETDSEAGVCASWPIVTAGASGSLAVTVTSFSANNIPAKNFVFYAEYTPTSQFQMGNGCFLFDLYLDANNTYTWFSGISSNANFKLRFNSTNYISNYSKFLVHPRTSAIAFKNDLVGGLVPFCNGARGNIAFSYKTTAALTGGTVYLGQTTYTNSLQYHGQIANIKIWEGYYSDATIKDITNIYPEELYDIGQVGIPTYDPRKADRIWAMRYDGTNFDAIQFSDTWGATWEVWHVLDNTTLEPTIALDSTGNVYYFTDATNYAQQNLYRIDALTKAETAEIAPSNAKNWSWQSWAWGETSTGTLYTSFYTLDGTDGQTIYIGTVGGTSWATSSVLINGTDRHVHSLHVDQSDDKAWVSWGDAVATRGTAWSDDDFGTITTITDGVTDGPTGIAFTPEGIYISSDSVGAQNYVRSITDDANAVTRITMPQPFQISPLYYIRSIANNKNELWISARNETVNVSQCPALFKFTKTDGIASQWRIAKIILSDEPVQTGSSAHVIAGGLNGTIPDVPYLFLYRARDNTTTNGGLPALGVYRVQRA